MSEIIRRDPRAEWIARNRLHPLHAAMQSAQGGESRWMGPNGVVRKNPHAVGFIGANGVKRIDRSGGQQGTAGGKRSSAPEVMQLPLASLGIGWVLPALVGFLIGISPIGRKIGECVRNR